MPRLTFFIVGLSTLRDWLFADQPEYYKTLEAAAENVQCCTTEAQSCCNATSQEARKAAFSAFLTKRTVARTSIKAIRRAIENSFLPPINDRESHMFADALSRVVKAIKVALRDAEMLALPSEIKGSADMGRLIAEAGNNIVRGVKLLQRKNWETLVDLAHGIHDLEERSDKIFLDAVEELNRSEPGSAAELRLALNIERYLSRLESILDECAAVANVLQTIASGNR
jgi:uncharacterized protein Yka (UPF0111/DUF47 family)